MRKYQTQEACFSLPEQFHDHSMNVFSLGTGEPSEVSCVVSRDTMKAGETLESYIDKQLDALQKQIATLKLHHRSRMAVQGRDAVSLELFWTAHGKALAQWQVAIARTTVDIVVFTATCEIQHAERWQPVFHEIVQSVQWVDQPA